MQNIALPKSAIAAATVFNAEGYVEWSNRLAKAWTQIESLKNQGIALDGIEALFDECVEFVDSFFEDQF